MTIMSYHLTLFLQVTCTRYFVSSHNESCTFEVSVSMLPFSPPPEISHVTRHSCGAISGCQATSALTSDSFLVIVTIRSGHVLRLVLIFALVVHWSQHCKERKELSLALGFQSSKVHCMVTKNDEPICEDGRIGCTRQTYISASDYYYC
jgi:hypothetical protein